MEARIIPCRGNMRKHNALKKTKSIIFWAKTKNWVSYSASSNQMQGHGFNAWVRCPREIRSGLWKSKLVKER